MSMPVLTRLVEHSLASWRRSLSPEARRELLLSARLDAPLVSVFVPLKSSDGREVPITKVVDALALLVQHGAVPRVRVLETARSLGSPQWFVVAPCCVLDEKRLTAALDTASELVGERVFALEFLGR